MVGWVETFLKGIEVSDETLALDVIAQAGPDGQYLNKEHTRTHFRDVWYPNLFERDDYLTWQDRGCTTLAERAAERVEKILQQHRPEPLPDDVKAQLEKIVQRAESNAGR